MFQQIVGSDIAELLMQGSQSDGSWESDAPTLIDFSDSSTAEAPPCKGDDLLTGNWSSFSYENSEKALQSYTQLLLAGRKKVLPLYLSILQIFISVPQMTYYINYFVCDYLDTNHHMIK